MAKWQRNTTGYTQFGKLLDELCTQQEMSFRRLAAESGMSRNSQMSIVRACRGEYVPLRDNILAWCRVLQTNQQQRRKMLHHFHYAGPEEEEDDAQAE